MLTLKLLMAFLLIPIVIHESSETHDNHKSLFCPCFLFFYPDYVTSYIKRDENAFIYIWKPVDLNVKLLQNILFVNAYICYNRCSDSIDQI